MDGRSVCTPLLAESDAQNDNTSPPNAASVTDADKVINTKIDSTQVEGDRSEEELLKGLLTDDYCRVCEAVLLFESQRLSHYEGKKHAQKVRGYLQAKRAERMHRESTGAQRTMTADKDRFCELCNMVFSSHVVAKSHYEGKVHMKNLRKQGLRPPDRNPEVHILPDVNQDTNNANQKPAPEGGMEHPQDPTSTSTSPGTEVDLSDPNKCCALCAAFFNNPQMALQHYNGRKHQRNQSRQELLRELGDNVQQANSLMCQMCSVQFNSVEMYQAHMQGNKHQIREKKVINLCKSQQKVYSTFADELSDYIQVQKARGITPKTGPAPPPGDPQREGGEEEEEDVGMADIMELKKPAPNFTPTSNIPHHSRFVYHNPLEGWRPPYRGLYRPTHGSDPSCPPPGHTGSALLSGRPMKRRRERKQSSSSSYVTSSSYSSSFSSSYSSSSTSDSDDAEYRRREKRRIRRPRKERDKRTTEGDSDKGERKRRRKGRRRERDGRHSEERRGGESGESEEERRRKKSHGKRKRRDRKQQEDTGEAVGEERVMDNLLPEHMMDDRRETEAQTEAEMKVEQGEGGRDGPAKPKYRKEKKKTKEKVDTRTEEEKLWDDSILGC